MNDEDDDFVSLGEARCSDEFHAEAPNVLVKCSRLEDEISVILDCTQSSSDWMFRCQLEDCCGLEFFLNRENVKILAAILNKWLKAN